MSAMAVGLVVGCGAASLPCPTAPVASEAFDLRANDIQTCLITAEHAECWGAWSVSGCEPLQAEISPGTMVTLGSQHVCFVDERGATCQHGSAFRTVENLPGGIDRLEIGSPTAWVIAGERWGTFYPTARMLDGVLLPLRVRWSDTPWLRDARFATAGGSLAMMIAPGGEAIELAGFRVTGRTVALGSDVVGVSGDLEHGCVIRGAARAVSCWGFAGPEITATGIEAVAQVTVRFLHACVRTDEGAIFCIGHNGCDARPVGLGGPANECDAATFATMRLVALPGPARALALGAHHACAALIDGSVWCWGSNFYGQLGDGTRVDSSDPVRATGPENPRLSRPSR